MSIIKSPSVTKRYPIENGEVVIEIVIPNFHSLFDERDPAPFRVKDLDDDAVDYIVTSASEVPLSKLGKIKILVQDDYSTDLPMMISSAIHSFFSYESDMMAKKIRSTLSQGFKSLLIGIIFLTSAVFISYALNASSEDFLMMVLKEGMILIGWVSMWKPINVFLYDWWPLADKLKLYNHLSDIEVQVLEFRSSRI